MVINEDFLSLIHDGMSSNLLLLITGERDNRSSISIEFADNCCIIMISNDETDEIYWY